MTELTPGTSSPLDEGTPTLVNHLVQEVERRAPADAAALLEECSPEMIAQVLTKITPSLALKVCLRFPETLEREILSKTSETLAAQWRKNQIYPGDTVGRLMDPPVGLFPSGITVKEAVARLREEVQTAFITYGYVVNPDNQLLGVVVMRDFLLAAPDSHLDEFMVRNPYTLKPNMLLRDAVKEVVHRHYPVYPVCDHSGKLLGLVRGYALFQEQTKELTAQPGRMVGVVEEERLSTPWGRSFRSRHPWLQLNLLTAFAAAFVVGVFEDTIDQVVLLAVFLPVLAGQSGNTGCQALAVTLRGLTLGELTEGSAKPLVIKEAWLGFLNGTFVGIVAGLMMFGYATLQGTHSPWLLGLVVCIAMIASCMVSGIAGALVPLGLQKLGADPATASSIFLTTATDVASMGCFLGLATIFIL